MAAGGADPQGIPNNLFPFITQVAGGQRETLRIFGSDWPTPDGTGVRDDLHVMDLAEAHGLALAWLQRHVAGPGRRRTHGATPAC